MSLFNEALVGAACETFPESLSYSTADDDPPSMYMEWIDFALDDGVAAITNDAEVIAFAAPDDIGGLCYTGDPIQLTDLMTDMIAGLLFDQLIVYGFKVDDEHIPEAADRDDAGTPELATVPAYP